MSILSIDRLASRRFWIILFVIITLGGGVVAFLTADKEAAITRRSGSPTMVIKNLTAFDVRIKGNIYMYYDKGIQNTPSSQIYFTIPAFSTKELTDRNDKLARIGMIGSSMDIRLSKTGDATHQISFELKFDGKESSEEKEEIRMKRHWTNEGWVITFEEKSND